MIWIDGLGLFGAFLSAITFVPQVYKAWQTKSTGDLSVWMIFILLANVSTWLIMESLKKILLSYWQTPLYFLYRCCYCILN